MEVLKEKKNIIFGTGKFMREIKNLKPKYYLDNDSKKQGKDISGIPILSPEILKSENLNEIFIYIAITDYHDVSEQLNLMGLQEHIHYGSADVLLNHDQIREVYGIGKEYEDDFVDIFLKCKNFTMTSIERMYALYQAVKYVSLNKILGDFVECGVWRGGSSMVMAHTLLKLQDTTRKLYLYDTFTGMSEPTENDMDIDNKIAYKEWVDSEVDGYNEWCYASIEDVKSNLLSTGYEAEKLFLVKGKVEETIPNTLPNNIALLRLDTDWYESTYHEMLHLYPKLNTGGVLIIDDYGHWQGAKKAINQYLEENHLNLLLNKIDYTGRLAIKVGI